MAQFDVYPANPTTRGIFPRMLDVQSDLPDDLPTRLVIPRTQSRTLSRTSMITLTPAIW